MHEQRFSYSLTVTFFLFIQTFFLKNIAGVQDNIMPEFCQGVTVGGLCKKIPQPTEIIALNGESPLPKNFRELGKRGFEEYRKFECRKEVRIVPRSREWL